jgi:death-on-curing protein
METVIALQERLVAEFGGVGGIRDHGLLDSALNLETAFARARSSQGPGDKELCRDGTDHLADMPRCSAIFSRSGLCEPRTRSTAVSRLNRPRQLFHYEKFDLFGLAAARAFGLARNHPFLNGNKRIAFATAVLFLELNGARFEATEADSVLQTLALAAGELDQAGFAAWLRSNCRKD